MSDTSIRVSEETKARLDLCKRSGESYDDVIRRLASGDKWAGFGALADTDGDTREGMARIRAEFRGGTAEDIAETE
ncbi:MAG: antitoxin VapB family protein [Halobacteriaceae archaeon]